MIAQCIALVERLDMDNRASAMKLWMEIDPLDQLRRAWLIEHSQTTVAVIWVVMHGLNIAVNLLKHSQSSIDKMWVVKRVPLLAFLKNQKENILNGITAHIIPEAVHMVFNNVPDLREQADPFIEFISSEVLKFQNIPSYIEYIHLLEQKLNQIYFLYEGKLVDFTAPPALFQLMDNPRN